MNKTCKTHVDACRFCWMCRHICPIGIATGQERNNARARALALSLVERGALEPEEAVENLYECALCGACTKECVTGWDPVQFTRAARLDAALAGTLPASIGRLVDRCIERGSAYAPAGAGGALERAAAAHREPTDTLLFLGVDAREKAPDAAAAAIRTVERTGLAFTVLADEPPSGWQLNDLIGAAEETAQQMRACTAALNRFARIVVYDPQDLRVFRREYAELRLGLAAKTASFPAFLAQMLDEGRLSPVQSGRRAVLQDPFQLARDLDETQPARRVAGAYARCGEMLLHGKDAMWAGNLLMREWLPHVMEQTARGRLKNAEAVGAELLVTASVSEYASLKAVSQTAVRVVSLEELVLGE